MLFAIFWKVPVEKTDDAIFSYEQLKQARIDGIKDIRSYLLAEVTDRCWRGITLVEAETDSALHEVVHRLAAQMDMEVEPALGEEEALRFWRETYLPRQ